MQLKHVLKSISETYDFEKNPNVIFLNTGDILAGKILHHDYSDAKFLPGQAKKSIQNNDILFSEIRPANQRFALVNVENPGDYVVSTKLMVLRCYNPNYSVEYVYNFLTQPAILAQLQALAESRSGTFPQITFSEIESLEIPDISIEEQQHIVDVLGTLDDRIENIDKISLKIQEYGNKLFSLIPLNKLEKLTDVVTFTKGKEIGSFNYLDKQIDGTVPYIRVGDLIGRNVATFTISKDVPLCTEEDILIAFDGAPGRNNYGLKGAISSGIQRVDCEQTIKGFVYFYLNSELCQNTIKKYTTATTIAHAGKSINVLQIPIVDDIVIYDKFNALFTHLVALSKEKDVLQQLKQLYLQKFFG